MDLIANYSADEEEPADEVPTTQKVQLLKLKPVSAAPPVSVKGLALVEDKAVRRDDALHLQDAHATTIYSNLPYDQMHAPVVGPAHPYRKEGLGAPRNHRAGHVESTNLSSFAFDEQYNTFHALGYAVAPVDGVVVGDTEKFEQLQGATAMTGQPAKKRKSAQERQEEKERKKAAIAAVVPDEPFQIVSRQPWADKEVAPAQLTEEQQAYLDSLKKDKDKGEEEEAAEKVVEAGSEPTELKEGQKCRSFFHGKENKDYQGRSWVDSPKELRPDNEVCYVPKRWIHTFSGHTKGVNKIQFFPGTGHLLLSAGLDGKIKIWSSHGSYKCMRTYMGHTKGVREINFSIDGRKFVSSGYDKAMRVWDTETGKVLGSYGEGKMNYCAVFHPEQPNVLMAGAGDKKIYQWDMDTGELQQQYDYHLGAVNTITFIDNNRRFVSTSDDKTIRVWEFGIPVQVKYIADPSMHSMPAVAVSPSKAWWIAQSLDNQIITYTANDRFKHNKKKTFKGHTVAGYACAVGFAGDSKYVISGDGDGRLFIWDWKTCKIFRTLKAHEGVCIGAAWHPLESSKVATCGWDGLIKYWD